MTYAFVLDVPMSAEQYEIVHREVVRRAGDRVDGMLLHLARATATGFQVTEVWKSKPQCDRFNNEVVGPVIAEMTAGEAPAGEPVVQEFQPRGLIIAGTDVAISA